MENNELPSKTIEVQMKLRGIYERPKYCPKCNSKNIEPSHSLQEDGPIIYCYTCKDCEHRFIVKDIREKEDYGKE